MTTESFLLFFFKHNAVLIESLVALILLLAAFFAYRSFKIAKSEEIGGKFDGKFAGANTDHLEDMLKKILERANQLPTASAGASASSASAENSKSASGKATAASKAPASAGGDQQQALLEQIGVLKKDLESKKAEIDAIKSKSVQGAEVAAGPTAEEKANLEAQIKELQKKLEEFDIISADIADLSFYKDENLRLQKELAGFKGGAPATAAVAPTPTASAPIEIPAETAAANLATPAAPAVFSNVEIAKNATTPPAATEEVVSATAATPAVPETAVQEVVDEDLIKEYAAMVDAQRSAQPAQPSQATVATPPASGREGVDLGTMDLDKMAAEAGSLSEAAETAPDVNVLNQAIDPDKLAEEAGSMDIDPQTKEVMGQFEQFAKKEK